MFQTLLLIIPIAIVAASWLLTKPRLAVRRRASPASRLSAGPIRDL
jgi:hypothetical protein